MKTVIDCCLFLLIAACLHAQETTGLTPSTLNGKDGYFKTYEDFLKGNMIEGEFIKVGFNRTSSGLLSSFAIFKIAGKKVNINYTDMWGFRGDSYLYRMHKSASDNRAMKVVFAGQMVIYVYPSSGCSTQDKAEYKIILYGGDKYAMFISKDLNSDMIPVAWNKKNQSPDAQKQFNDFKRKNQQDLASFFTCVDEQPFVADVADCIYSTSATKFIWVEHFNPKPGKKSTPAYETAGSNVKLVVMAEGYMPH